MTAVGERPGGSLRTVDTDVVVVGAGPSGLMLAGELRLGGAEVIVVERLAEPTGQSRGLGFTARAMEVFDQRGLLPGFGAVETSPLGHFGGVPFDYTVLPDGHFGARGIPQSRTESVLEQWAVGLGAELRRGCELTAVADLGDHAEVVVRGTDGDGGERRLRAWYVVGADGGRSAVRRAAGFAFPGTEATRGMYLADVVGCDLRPRFLGERLDGGMVMAAPLEPGVDRIIVCEHGTPPPGRDGAELEFAELAQAWHRLTGDDISHGDARWVSSFTDATRQATEYRRGRVLLVGDAAHVHLPAGGQGLSTGVQDAVNLGWKLAATVRGWAPADLLDTYHTERHPVGARVLWNSRAQGLVFLGGEETDPLSRLLGELLTHDEVKRHLAGVVSGLDIRYDVGAGEHALLGERMPPRRLVGTETTTLSALRRARGVLFDLRAPDGGGDEDPDVPAPTAAWGDRVDVLRHRPEPHPGPGPDPLADVRRALVRPDGHVVWVDADLDPSRTADPDPECAAALRRWFGAPTTILQEASR